VYHDIQVIRKLRNTFAHSYNPVSLDEGETRNLIQSLRVPCRQFYDWGQLRAASTDDGVVIYRMSRQKRETNCTSLVPPHFGWPFPSSSRCLHRISAFHSQLMRKER
jgi:hypothetical protein